MADEEDAGPPPLEDPNSPDYVCVTCQNNVNALCLACQEMAQLRANSTRNERDNSDRDTPQPMSDSDSSDSAYDVDTISDSPRSTDTTLVIDFIENVDETGTVLIAKNVMMKRLKFKPLILDGRFERDSDTETDYSDMPPLEETKKTKDDSDEDSGDMPPLEEN